MAKLTVEIELDWLTEDGDVDAAAKSEIVNSIVRQLSNGVKEQIVKEASSRIRAIDGAAAEIKKRLEQYIETQLKTQIGENVAQVIGLKDIVKNLPSSVMD